MVDFPYTDKFVNVPSLQVFIFEMRTVYKLRTYCIDEIEKLQFFLNSRNKRKSFPPNPYSNEFSTAGRYRFLPSHHLLNRQ